MVAFHVKENAKGRGQSAESNICSVGGDLAWWILRQQKRNSNDAKVS
jgi:hypothetical protein